MINNKFASKKIEKIIKQKASCSDLFVLCGQINLQIVHSSIHIIENKLIKLEYSKSMISKIKLLAIEMMQNILKHQMKKATVTPCFILTAHKKHLSLVTGNSVSAKESLSLKKKLENYESLSQIELKEKYLKRLGKGKISKEGNAGLGIMTIYNRSNKNSTHMLSRISDTEYYFSLEVNLLIDN